MIFSIGAFLLLGFGLFCWLVGSDVHKVPRPVLAMAGWACIFGWLFIAASAILALARYAP
jgi:hypothetical protein